MRDFSSAIFLRAFGNKAFVPFLGTRPISTQTAMRNQKVQNSGRWKSSKSRRFAEPSEFPGPFHDDFQADEQQHQNICTVRKNGENFPKDGRTTRLRKLHEDDTGAFRR